MLYEGHALYRQPLLRNFYTVCLQAMLMEASFCSHLKPVGHFSVSHMQDKKF
jgi:hypothetical protein